MNLNNLLAMWMLLSLNIHSANLLNITIKRFFASIGELKPEVPAIFLKAPVKVLSDSERALKEKIAFMKGENKQEAAQDARYILEHLPLFLGATKEEITHHHFMLAKKYLLRKNCSAELEKYSSFTKAGFFSEGDFMLMELVLLKTGDEDHLANMLKVLAWAQELFEANYHKAYIQVENPSSDSFKEGARLIKKISHELVEIIKQTSLHEAISTLEIYLKDPDLFEDATKILFKE